MFNFAFCNRHSVNSDSLSLQSIPFQQMGEKRKAAREVWLDKGAAVSGVRSSCFGGIHFTTENVCA